MLNVTSSPSGLVSPTTMICNQFNLVSTNTIISIIIIYMDSSVLASTGGQLNITFDLFSSFSDTQNYSAPAPLTLFYHNSYKFK